VLTDPIADMLSRIRNANRALHDHVDMPNSRMKEEIARLLKEEGYIRDYRVIGADEWNDAPEERDHRAYNTLVIDLKFGRSRERVITNLKRVSKPGRRIYARKDRLPRVLGGMGVAILSTSNGLITSRTAEEKGVGGEVVCFIW
jgi:small subunit ribosomal protein S8